MANIVNMVKWKISKRKNVKDSIDKENAYNKKRNKKYTNSLLVCNCQGFQNTYFNNQQFLIVLMITLLEDSNRDTKENFFFVPEFQSLENYFLTKTSHWHYYDEKHKQFCGIDIPQNCWTWTNVSNLVL